MKANNKPALIVGGTDTGAHLEFDGNEIQAKNNGTTATNLFINEDGGDVSIARMGNTYIGNTSGNATIAPNGNVYMSSNNGGHVYVGNNSTNTNLYVGKSGGSSKIYLNGNLLAFEDTVLTKAQVCEYMYPVGSVYINDSKTDNPKDLLGCGTWYSISANYYLMAASASKSYAEYNAYNNSYGNYASYYLDECLPNIVGVVTDLIADKGSISGAFYTQEGLGSMATKGSYYGTKKVTFNASQYNSIYRSNCNAVRPKSYVVYIWVRGA